MNFPAYEKMLIDLIKKVLAEHNKVCEDIHLAIQMYDVPTPILWDLRNLQLQKGGEVHRCIRRAKKLFGEMKVDETAAELHKAEELMAEHRAAVDGFLRTVPKPADRKTVN